MEPREERERRLATHRASPFTCTAGEQRVIFGDSHREIFAAISFPLLSRVCPSNLEIGEEKAANEACLRLNSILLTRD